MCLIDNTPSVWEYEKTGLYTRNAEKLRHKEAGRGGLADDVLRARICTVVASPRRQSTTSSRQPWTCTLLSIRIGGPGDRARAVRLGPTARAFLMCAGAGRGRAYLLPRPGPLGWAGQVRAHIQGDGADFAARSLEGRAGASASAMSELGHEEAVEMREDARMKQPLRFARLSRRKNDAGSY
ncbi:uncharacterized protein SCHCODRAFT_02662683 [Schizophyllum commune H4-8]|nr:uncharacterized protein SCHCODRAFT_02662683 [Schizophyllum commune H4-8]KAI5897715.1 hypothetical protein SCHCODRAFT_02662683 [Schizophyllum commune H4-8]